MVFYRIVLRLAALYSLFILCFVGIFMRCHAELDTYIVHVIPPEGMTFSSRADLEAWHISFLPDTTAEPRMLHSYRDVISGFAARLTAAEAIEMSKKSGFVRVMPDLIIPLSTSRTPKFIGLQRGIGLWNNSNQGRGVIIGVLDTGITLTHPSFRDEGLLQPPSRWKGSCTSTNRCNNKIIGLRSFISSGNETNNPTDFSGHGTHTASTAAGNFVNSANELNQAFGTASGMAPMAHLAIYKVCTVSGCAGADILAGIDAAIADGVDILSISIAGRAFPFYRDPIAIGAFAAVQKGIFVSCAGGNTGPEDGSVKNGAPWILTVAASTVDRSLRSTVTLGNGQVLNGESIYQPPNFTSMQLPLLAPDSDPYCGSLDGIHVNGKVVICLVGVSSLALKGKVVAEAGGAAMIVVNHALLNNTIILARYPLPSSYVTFSAGLDILSYMEATKNPTAAITFKGTIIGTTPAPTLAAFSSRGPSPENTQILKPDISGPGVNILAASIPSNPSSSSTQNPQFAMGSGTSMATPHLAGVAALIKSAHPDWSPAAIKSAIMTTSNNMDNTGQPIKDQDLRPAKFFSMGAGHVNATNTANPGLIFDINPKDYIGYLCGLGYTDEDVSVLACRKTRCSEIKPILQSELNYPAIVLNLGPSSSMATRTVTNVGDASSTYTMKADTQGLFTVSMDPPTLVFSQANEKKDFTVRVKGTRAGAGNLKLVSNNKKYIVRVPIIVI